VLAVVSLPRRPSELAALINTRAVRLRTVGGYQRRQIGKPGVAVLFDEAGDVVASASSALVADEFQRRLADVGQGDGVTGHAGRIEQNGNEGEGKIKKAA